MNSNTAKLSRRRFLRRSATALGAAFAAPTIIPASALGRGGVKAPSERIAMGFIGVGGQGGGHLLGGAWTYVPGGYSARRDVQVLAVCDAWKDRRENATQRVNDNYAELFGKGKYQSCEAYRDFRLESVRASQAGSGWIGLGSRARPGVVAGIRRCRARPHVHRHRRHQLGAAPL